MKNIKEPISMKDIKIKFDLLKKCTGESGALVEKLAIELGIKKTELMQIVVDNPTTIKWMSGLKTGRAYITEINFNNL